MGRQSQLTLTDVCKQIVDCEHKTAPTQGQGYPSIRTPNIGRGRLILDGVNRVSEDTYRAWTRRAVPRAGDLVLAREAPVGNVAIIPEGLQVCLGQRTVLLRPDPLVINPAYLAYLLLGDEIQARFQGIAAGATVPHLNVDDIRSHVLPPLPPRKAQDSIASILSAYDDLIENNERRIRILEELARRLYREWFVHFRFPGHERVKLVESAVGRVPEGWEVKRLGDLAEQVRDSVMPDGVPPDTPYFGLEHLPRRSITLGEWGAASAVQSTKLAFRKGDILFGKIRPYFHKVGVAPVDGLCSSDTIVIRSLRPDHFGLVLGCVSSDEFVAHATQTSQGTKMPRANWGVLTRYPLPLPPVRVLRQFSSFATDAVAMTQNLLFRNRNLRETRDLLLPKLVSGEVDVSALTIDR